jgi:hypothetical protein
MIQVTMRDQYLIEPFEADPGLKDLPLSAFSAIHQEAMLIMLNDLSRCR